MNRRFWIEALALSVGVIGLMYVYFSNQTIIKHGKKVRLAISGYDPRDLFSGYYIRYQVDFGGGVCANNTGRELQDLCLVDKGEQMYVAGGWRSEESSCRTFIRGRCKGESFEAGIERYYISERNRHLIQTIPEGSSIVLSLSSSGQAVVQDLWVGGQPIREWLAQQNQKTVK